LKAVQENDPQLEFTSGSRIVNLPGKEETIRSFQGGGTKETGEGKRPMRYCDF